MSDTTRVGLTIGADASEFQRQLRGVNRELDRMDRTIGRGAKKGFFDADDVEEYERSVRKAERQIANLAREYRRVTSEVKKLEQEQQKLIDSGQKLTQQQKEQLAMLRAHQSASGMALQSAQGHYGSMIQEGGGIHRRGAMGSAMAMMGRRLGGPLAVTMMAGRWLMGQAGQGEQTLMANEMSRMGVDRTGGMMRGSVRAGAFEQERRGHERYGRSLAYTTAQTNEFLVSSMRALGSGHAGMSGIRSNLNIMRALNLDPGVVMGLQEQSRQAGGSTDAIRINRALVQGLRYGGFSQALASEFGGALQGVLGTLAPSQRSVDVRTMSGLLGLVSRRLGVSPNRGAGILSDLHGTIQGPGGGEAGQGFMLRAFGFGRGTSYLKAYERTQRGLTPDNLRDMLAQVKREHPGNLDMQAYFLSKLSGERIKMWAARGLLKMKPGDLTKEAIARSMGEVPGGTDKDIAAQAKDTRRRTYMTGRIIMLQEMQAYLRALADPAYVKALQAQIWALKKAGQGVKWYTQYLTYFHQMGQRHRSWWQQHAPWMFPKQGGPKGPQKNPQANGRGHRQAPGK